MVVVSYSGKEINAKVVYYGAGLCGKTTNLEAIYEAVPETSRGKMVSMKTQSDRTLFFDLLPLDLGEIMGFKTRFLLYTVPGQVFYNATRKLVLKGADAIVFVADSAQGKMDENKESLANLRTNLTEYGLKLDETPWVLQYNKRDLPSTYTIDEMNAGLNPDGKVPFFEAVAMQGTGVFETFRGISHLLMQKVTRELQRTPGGARSARLAEEHTARAAERRAADGVVPGETAARGALPGLELASDRKTPAAPPTVGRMLDITEGPPAVPAARAAAPPPAPAPAAEEPGLAIDFSRDLSLEGGGSSAPRLDTNASDGFGIEKESSASTRIVPDEDEEDGSPRKAPGRPRFEERTLTFGNPAGRAATAPAAAPAQEVTIPVRIPAGGSRQIVLRITIETDAEAA